MILDTNAVSALAENDPGLRAKLPTDRPWYLPVVVIGEFRFGIAGSRYAERLEEWLSELISVVPVLDITESTANHYARVRHQLKRDNRKIPPNDTWIAALALEHSQPILSRDGDFGQVEGLVTVGW
jgi:tRNA(fMet)-specific endonuclease VapC